VTKFFCRNGLARFPLEELLEIGLLTSPRGSCPASARPQGCCKVGSRLAAGGAPVFAAPGSRAFTITPTTPFCCRAFCATSASAQSIPSPAAGEPNESLKVMRPSVASPELNLKEVESRATRATTLCGQRAPHRSIRARCAPAGSPLNRSTRAHLIPFPTATSLALPRQPHPPWPGRASGFSQRRNFWMPRRVGGAWPRTTLGGLHNQRDERVARMGVVGHGTNAVRTSTMASKNAAASSMMALVGGFQGRAVDRGQSGRLSGEHRSER